MIPENNPLDRPKVDRGSHKERARVKADAARTLASIDDLLAGGTGRPGVADIDKIFPTTPEDEALFDSVVQKKKDNGQDISQIGPGAVAYYMRNEHQWNNRQDRDRYSDLRSARSRHMTDGNQDQHRAALEAMDETYRRGVNQVGAQWPADSYEEARNIVDPEEREDYDSFIDNSAYDRMNVPTSVRSSSSDVLPGETFHHVTELSAADGIDHNIPGNRAAIAYEQDFFGHDDTNRGW